VQKGIYDEKYITIRSVKVCLFDFLGGSVPWSLDGEYGGETTEVAVQVVRHGIKIFKPTEETT